MSIEDHEELPIRNLVKRVLLFAVKSFIGLIISMILILILFCGYGPRHPYVVIPLTTRVVDFESGKPVVGAQVLRIVDDFHGYRNEYTFAVMDRSYSDENGKIEMKGKQIWQFRPAGPGRMPVPNHKIAIWKPGYKAFIFSQYSSIFEIYSRTGREDLKRAIEEIPLNRIEYGMSDKPDEMLVDGTLKLYTIRAADKMK